MYVKSKKKSPCGYNLRAVSYLSRPSGVLLLALNGATFTFLIDTLKRLVSNPIPVAELPAPLQLLFP